MEHEEKDVQQEGLGASDGLYVYDVGGPGVLSSVKGETARNIESGVRGYDICTRSQVD